MSCAAIPTLKSIQNIVYRIKKRRVKGVQISTRLELMEYCQQHRLPPQDVCRQLSTNPDAEAVIDLMNRSYVYIPQNAAAFGVDGACFTGPRQIAWMRQLLEHDREFVLHMDGKHK